MTKNQQKRWNSEEIITIEMLIKVMMAWSGWLHCPKIRMFDYDIELSIALHSMLGKKLVLISYGTKWKIVSKILRNVLFFLFIDVTSKSCPIEMIDWCTDMLT